MAETVISGKRYDITIEQGCSWSLPFRRRKKADGTPLTLAGLSLRGQIRQDKDQTSPLLATMTVTVTDPSSNGEGLAYIGATVTATMTMGGWYDVEAFDPLNLDNVVRVLEGKVALDKGVTV